MLDRMLAVGILLWCTGCMSATETRKVERETIQTRADEQRREESRIQYDKMDRFRTLLKKTDDDAASILSKAESDLKLKVPQAVKKLTTCIVDKAYKLAISTEAADIVARAAIASCDEDQENLRGLLQRARGPDIAREGLATSMDFLRDIAIKNVIEYRQALSLAREGYKRPKPPPVLPRNTLPGLSI